MSDNWSRTHQALLLEARDGHKEVNLRTGQVVRVLEGQQAFNIDLQGALLPVPGNRVYRPRVAAAEFAWMLSGEKSIHWLAKHCGIWNQFAVDGQVTSAYGYRWRHAFGRDQLVLAAEALQDNPSDRQVVLMAWDPREDGLGEGLHMNVPCPTQVVLNVVNGRLHGTVAIRSSDLFVGLPYDVMVYSMLLVSMAYELNLEPGILGFSIAHAHLYEEHVVDVIHHHHHPVFMPTMPTWPISGILASPDAYVAEVEKHSSAWESPTDWDPRPEVFT